MHRFAISGLAAVVAATLWFMPAAAQTSGAGDWLILWASADSDAAARAAEERWFRLVSQGEIDHLRLAPGFPTTLLSDPFRSLQPGRRLVVLGACSQREAERQVRALRRFNDDLRALRVPGHPLAGSCPSLTKAQSPSLTALLTHRYPELAKGSERRKARVPLCALDPTALRQRFGESYLCQALWGIDCDLFDELLAVAAFDNAVPCTWLLGAGDAIHPYHGVAGDLALDVCSDGKVAFIFTSGNGDELTPVDAICNGGLNPEVAADFSATYAMQDAVCVEYLRLLPQPDRPRDQWQYDVGLRCYALRAGRPAVFEQALAHAKLGETSASRYAVVSNSDGSTALCVAHGDRRFAFTLGPRGFRAAPSRAAQCAAANLHPPRHPDGKSRGPAR